MTRSTTSSTSGLTTSFLPSSSVMTASDVCTRRIDDQLFAAEQRDDGIGRVLDRFDEVSVHDKLRAVQARHIDHKTSNPLGVSPGVRFLRSGTAGPRVDG